MDERHVELEVKDDVVVGIKEPKRVWISIEDRKPPNDIPVLVNIYREHKGNEFEHVCIASRMDYQWIDPADGSVMEMKRCCVTHWQPLPERAGFSKWKH